jgi:hypothetical protein
MFRGREGTGDIWRQREMARYPKGIVVIFNDKAYANGQNLKQWARQQYKWGSAFSPSENEPRLLTLDAFGAHKKKKPTEAEKRANDDFVSELKELNTSISMVPAGGTGYVQICDTVVNGTLKDLISEQEEIHYDLNEDKWRSGKFTVSDRRVLLAEWVFIAWNKFYEKYKDVIIEAF